MAGKSETKSVKEIFENMDYGTVQENFDLAKTWIEKHGLKVPRSDDEIENAIQNSEKQIKTWAAVSPSEKAKLLNKLASEIERHTGLICQIELFVRQILTKDSKNKSIRLFIDYLRYYCSWAYLIEKEFVDYKPYGFCAAYLDDSTPLAILGAILAPAIVAGNGIIFGVSSALIPIMCLIVELCENVGFPKGLISVVEVKNIEIFLSHKKIKKLTYIGNLYRKSNFDIHITNEKHLTTLHLGKSSSVIFDTADIDSAIDSIVESAWAYKGMFPCGINKLFVQETIFTEFVNRFKTRISKLNVEYFENTTGKTIDVLIPYEIIPDTIKVEVINKIPLQIGYKTFGQNILSYEDNTHILSILAFRTTNEAVALLNNRCGLATSVWTENISLANEVTTKLKSKIIWINTHGHINTNIAFSPTIRNGQGYFGGKEGLLEYIIYSKSNENEVPVLKEITIESYLPSATNKRTINLYYGGSFQKSESGLPEADFEHPNKRDVRNCVEIAKKSYQIWSTMNPKTRSQHLLKLADLSESIKIKNTVLLQTWVENLRNWAMLYDSINSSFQQGNPELKITKEPLGIIVVDIYNDANFIYLTVIISALISGNVLILLNYSNDLEEFLLELCKIFPSSGILAGCFNVIFNPNKEVIETLQTHREVQRYFNLYKNHITFKQMQSVIPFKYVKCNSFDVLNIVTSNKCIWTSVGESFL